MGSRGARGGGKTRLGQIHRLKSTGKIFDATEKF